MNKYQFLSEAEIKNFRLIFVGILAFCFLMFLVAGLYKIYYFEQAFNSHERYNVSGPVTDVFGPSSYTSFNVSGVNFRSEFMFGPCLDIRGEIQTNRIVDIEYIMIEDWLYTKRGYGCILNIDYLSPKINRYRGQASRNN